MADSKIKQVIVELVAQAEHYDQVIEAIQQARRVDPTLLDGPQVVLLNAAPGLGKTHALVEAAEDVGLALPCLHLGPTHDSFENVDRHTMWGHWRGHEASCVRNVRATKGYTSGEVCTCQRAEPPYYTPVPTFAPVDYVLSSGQPDFPLDPIELMHPTPLARAAEQYSWWAIDDVGLDRFVGKLEISQRDLELTVAHYPPDIQGAEVVHNLSEALLGVVHQHALQEGTQDQPESWSGLNLYDYLDAALRKLGGSVEEVLAALRVLQFSQEPWPVHQDNPHDWPCNFMPRLQQKLVAEMSDWYLTNLGNDLGTGIRHPHIHVVWARPEGGGAVQSIIRIRWLRRLSWARPTLILDATANIELLRRACRIPNALIENSKHIDVPPFPEEMKVTQYLGAHLTKGTLKKSLQSYRQLVVDELTARRNSWTGEESPKVGLITFKELVGEFERVLEEVGFDEDHRVMDHYWNVRGSNAFTRCDFVVLVGYPIPNPQGLYEEACVLFSNDAEPVDRGRAYFERPMQLRNGQTLPITSIPGYADTRLQALYEQKSLSELYQALHRARPYAETNVREVLVFTDVPIDGVPVDGFFGREGKVFDMLSQLLQGTDGQVSLPVLLDALIQQGMDVSRNTLDKWVRRNAPWLAQAAGVWHIAGSSSSSPGAFRKRARRDIKLDTTVFTTPLDAALAYARAGLAVLPLRWPMAGGRCACRKACGSIGKHPRTRNGVKDATTDEARINWWWGKWPDANVGIAAGVVSGVVVLDVDPRNGGDASLEQLEQLHGPLPDTWRVATGGGGSHYYFHYPTDVASVRNTHQAEGLPGVEVKSDGLYVVAPPSLHESGLRYEWDANRHPLSADPPEWIISPPVDPLQSTGDGRQRPTARDLDNIQEQGAARGERDNAAIRVVGRMVALGEVNPNVLEESLLKWNQLNHPPIGEADGDPDPRRWAADKVRSVLRMEERKPRHL